MDTALVLIGVGCIIGAIVGGGVKLVQVELGQVASLVRQVILGVFGVVLVIAGLVAGGRLALPGAEPAPPAAAAPAGPDAENAAIMPGDMAADQPAQAMGDDSPASPASPPAAARAPGCLAGYVRREAFEGDGTCVPPEARDQAREDNDVAAERREPGGGAYGPDTCRPGYVWRLASPSDLVCVTPEQRDRTAEENALATSRMEPR